MELKTKYQYTYFIYPYIVQEKKYDKYMLNLLKNKKCKLKIFEKAKNLDIYTYFLPKVRNYMFWSFELNQNQFKKFNTLDTQIKSTLLSKKTCNIFEYELSKDIQGKVLDDNGIFFDINKMELICFNTGICFLVFKTTLKAGSDFSDVLNFNYKFRDINSEFKEYENIKIQTDKFKNVEEISSLIKEITGENELAKELNVDTERLTAYSYVCLDQMGWNDETDFEQVEKEFIKYSSMKPAGMQLNDSISKKDNVSKLESKYVKYGFSSYATALLTSDINTEYYTKLPFNYENRYLYMYIFNIYKKILLKKIDYDFSITKEFSKVKDKFVNFTKTIWIQEPTNDDTGKLLDKRWKEVLLSEEMYLKLKNKYDLLYKESNISKIKKHSKILTAVIIGIVVLNIVSLLLLFNLI